MSGDCSQRRPASPQKKINFARLTAPFQGDTVYHTDDRAKTPKHKRV